MKRFKNMNLWRHTSLRLRLMLVISTTALLIWAISTIVAWWQVRKEVNKVFDAQQILFAERLASSNLKTILIERRLDKPKRNPHRHKISKAHFDDDALAFAVFSANGDMLLNDGKNGEYFPFNSKAGFSQAPLNHNDADEWRIFWLPIAEGRLIVAVGQELDYRNELSEEMVFGQMWIWFASLPLLLGLMILVINYELRRLKQVGEQVAQRKPEDNTPLSSEVPSEILPLVSSLNHFFAKTSDLLLRERRFTSDAAHELRSPLAGLKVQTELAQLAGDDIELRQQALKNLTLGIDRAAQLIEQLLTLSRLDNLQALDGLEPIEWPMIIRSLIGERYFAAQTRQIELVYEEHSLPAIQYGQPLLLSLLLRNILDNAIKYAAEGSLVKISLTAKGLSIADNGGGVSKTDITSLGQRFYRPAGQNEKGSGLGLSIVKRIAALHHYHVEIENTFCLGKTGLQVKLSW